MSAKANGNKTISTSFVETSAFLKFEEKPKFQMFEYMNNINNLGNFYIKEESSFLKKIEKQNVKFYMDTDKYLHQKGELEKTLDQILISLFKQISIYSDEIERLNVKLKEKEGNERFNKLKNEESKKETTEKETAYYKSMIRTLEKKIIDKNSTEEKLKKENESYRRQITFYKEKLRIDLLSSRKIDINMSSTNNDANAVPQGTPKTKLSKKCCPSSRSRKPNHEKIDNEYLLATAEDNKGNTIHTFNQVISDSHGSKSIALRKYKNKKRQLSYSCERREIDQPAQRYQSHQRNISLKVKKALHSEKGISRAKANGECTATNRTIPDNAIIPDTCEIEESPTNRDYLNIAKEFEENITEELDLLDREEEMLRHVKEGITSIMNVYDSCSHRDNAGTPQNLKKETNKFNSHVVPNKQISSRVKK